MAFLSRKIAHTKFQAPRKTANGQTKNGKRNKNDKPQTGNRKPETEA
jgi:hypothetical protein